MGIFPKNTLVVVQTHNYGSGTDLFNFHSAQPQSDTTHVGASPRPQVFTQSCPGFPCLHNFPPGSTPPPPFGQPDGANPCHCLVPIEFFIPLCLSFPLHKFSPRENCNLPPHPPSATRWYQVRWHRPTVLGPD